MEIITFSVLMAITCILFIFAYFSKDFVFGFCSGALFLILGLSVFIGGLDLSSGEFNTHNLNLVTFEGVNESEITKQTGTITTITTYTNNSGVYVHGVGTILFILGLYINLVCWDLYKTSKTYDTNDED